MQPSSWYEQNTAEDSKQQKGNHISCLFLQALQNTHHLATLVMLLYFLDNQAPCFLNVQQGAGNEFS